MQHGAKGVRKVDHKRNIHAYINNLKPVDKTHENRQIKPNVEKTRARCLTKANKLAKLNRKQSKINKLPGQKNRENE